MSHKQLTEKQRQWAYIIAFSIILLCVIGYRGYHSLLPQASQHLAEQIPESVYDAIGKSSLEQFDKTEFEPTTLPDATQQAVKHAFDTLLRDLQLPADKFTLHFRYWNDQLNAFALMDGSIVVTDALVTRLYTQSKQPEQLLAVLLHEIGHIQHNHLMENTIRVSLFYITMSLFFGDIGVVSDLLIEGSTMGLNLSYSRGFEIEADQYAATNLVKLYGSSSPMIEALRELYKQAKEATNNDTEEKAPTFHWLSTHPTFEQRIEHLE